MVRIELVREKVRRIRETLAALKARLPEDASSMTGDRDVLDLVAFRFYLVVQDAIGVASGRACPSAASHILADEGWGPAPSLRDHFEILHKRGVIEAGLVGSLSGAIKVRNLIAHGYVAVDAGKLHVAATALEPLADSYCSAVLKWAEGRPPAPPS